MSEENQPTAGRTDDLRVRSIKKLTSPREYMAALPMTLEGERLVAEARAGAAAILRGEEDRLLAVVGPCSIHDIDQALEYGGKLADLSRELAGDLLILMRVYFEKPRTTVGWKGFINDPGLDDSFDINHGLFQARKLLLELARMGLPAATEFLDVITPQYIADAVAWGAIGARTTESQVHRQLASGLSMPVGFKNGTDGNLAIALDAIAAASQGHHFLSVTKEGTSAIVETSGNRDCHVILRGGKRPNYHAEDVSDAVAALEKRGLPSHVMVDCSHGNSRKDFANQPLVAADLARQLASGNRGITGVMVESHLQEGAQALKPGVELRHGVSVTDACISWETTVSVLRELAGAVKTRRNSTK